MTLARCIAFAALLLAAACNPDERRPGLWLKGEAVSAPVSDWSFTNGAQLVYVETKTWYGIPHSVTSTLVTSDGTLYVPSLYQDGGEFPNERYWNKNIARDPDVRILIDGKIYERRAALVTDAPERARVLDAFAAKYARWKEMLKNGEPEKPRIILLRMDARTPA